MEKDLSILTKSGSDSDNIKLNIKKRKIFQNYKVKIEAKLKDQKI
jgi:hypothetical protein